MERIDLPETSQLLPATDPVLGTALLMGNGKNADSAGAEGAIDHVVRELGKDKAADAASASLRDAWIPQQKVQTILYFGKKPGSKAFRLVFVALKGFV
jgi:hypothetical protein